MGHNAAAYYNEIDPFAAAWLRELMQEGLIAPGEVDERSVEDVAPEDLGGFVQCHFFAGIGVWSHALRLAGWEDHREIWTGSCPCQPFSSAGKGAGFDDERHLWPAFHWLIAERGPDVVLGEQVASPDGLAWLDLVSTDMEGSDYAFGALDTCAAGFSAPHIRQRAYWAGLRGSSLRLGHPFGQGLEGRVEPGRECADQCAIGQAGVADWMANAVPTGRPERRPEPRRGSPAGLCTTCGLALSNGRERDGRSIFAGGDLCGGEDAGRPQGDGGAQSRGLARRLDHAGRVGRKSRRHHDGDDDRQQLAATSRSNFGVSLRPLNYWRDADWLLCRDPDGPRFRPVEPGAFPLVDAGSLLNRLAEVRGAGNAINLAQAQGFIEAVMECMP